MFPVFRALACLLLLVCSAAAQATTSHSGHRLLGVICAYTSFDRSPMILTLEWCTCSQTTSCSKADQAQVSAILTAMCATAPKGSQSASASTSIPISVSLSHSSLGIPSSSLSGSTPVTDLHGTSYAAASNSNSAPSTSPTAGGAQGIHATPRMGLAGIVVAGLGLRLWIL
ncbi:hypothetical protein B0H13DRAFT_2151598 [Mycena leptocephala]|nr:hypothetical protein B0H13DRAFT_2151598 [Mycena leptocephala]